MEHRAAGQARTARQWLPRWRLRVELGSVCSFGCGFLPVGLSPQGRPGKLLDARHQAVALGPAGRRCLLILLGNGHKVKVKSDLLARASVATEVHQPVHVD